MNINLIQGKNLLEAFYLGLNWWTITCIMLSLLGPKVVKEIVIKGSKKK